MNMNPNQGAPAAQLQAAWTGAMPLLAAGQYFHQPVNSQHLGFAPPSQTAPIRTSAPQMAIPIAAGQMKLDNSAGASTFPAIPFFQMMQQQQQQQQQAPQSVASSISLIQQQHQQQLAAALPQTQNAGSSAATKKVSKSSKTSNAPPVLPPQDPIPSVPPGKK